MAKGRKPLTDYSNTSTQAVKKGKGKIESPTRGARKAETERYQDGERDRRERPSGDITAQRGGGGGVGGRRRGGG